ncbi:hypothetical protein Bca4012_060497 [Brassica carinata]
MFNPSREELRRFLVCTKERWLRTGWKPDAIAFSVLGKMFGEAGDYDGIRYVLQEMKSMDVVVYNTLLKAIIRRAGKPGLARKARWAKDACQLWEEMKAKKWPL